MTSSTQKNGTTQFTPLRGGDTLAAASEEALPSREERLRALAEGIPDYAIFALDAHGYVATWNAGAVQFKGYVAEEILGKHFSVFYSKKDVIEGKPERELEIARSHGKFEEEGWRVRKDGSQFWASVTITPMWDADKNLCGYTKVTRDITERIRMSGQVYSFFELSLDLLCVTGYDGFFKRLNPAWERVLGYSLEELMAVPWHDLIHPDDLETTLQVRANLTNEQHSSSSENRTRCKDGSYRWIEWIATSYPDQQVVLAVGRDITERNQASEMLRLQTERLREQAGLLELAQADLEKQQFLASIVTTQNEIAMAGPSLNTVMNLVAERTRILTNADAAIVELEEEGVLVYSAVSGMFADHVGLHCRVEGTLPGMCFRMGKPLRSDDTTMDPRCDHAACLRLNIRSMIVVPMFQDRQVIGVLQVVASTPQTFSEPHIHTLQLMAGLISAAVANVAAFEANQVLVRERAATLADLRASEEVLRKQSCELVRSNSDLEQFAYVASHDLQEPLRMIGSYLELLGLEYSERLDDEAREYIAYAVDGAVRMKCLINDLLAYSRVGTQGKPMQPTSVSSLLAEVLADLQLQIEETGAVITSDPLPTVSADGSQLRLVLQNLIGNAIKFRGAEAPRVHLSVADIDGAWRFSIRDNGIGIKTKHSERIFVIFQQLHGKNKYTGTGIGLSTCKRVVERHGGRIWVESEPGSGSTFYFTLPHATVTVLVTQEAHETCLN